jgi:hypothetical protein
MLSVLSSFVHAAKYISIKGEIFKLFSKVITSSFKVNSSVPFLSSLKLSPRRSSMKDDTSKAAAYRWVPCGI